MQQFLKLSALVATASLLAGFGYSALNSKPLTVDLALVTIDRTTGDRHYRGKSFTGEARTYSDEGVLIRAEQFTDGRRNGWFKMWFASGTPAFASTYRKGRRDGTSISWWSNGQLRSQTTFVNDLPHGEAWSWYRSGEKFKRYHYDNGQPVGLQQGWRQNGKLFSNFEYKNGRAYGLRNSNLCVELSDENIELRP